MNTFYWLLKREYWEHRGGLVRAPLITGAIFLALNVMGIIAGEVWRGKSNVHIGGMDMHMQGQITPQLLDKAGAALDASMYSVASVVWVVMAFVIFFYCLGALYDDRRDRSILFWNSLPISNRDTVLSKLVSASVIAPVIASIIGVVAAWLTLLIYAVTASVHGLSVFQLLWAAHPIRVALNMILSIPVYFLWALPTTGWLLLCSAWVRSKPFLWAVLLPLGAGVILSWLSLMGLLHDVAEWFWEHIVARVLLSLFPGGWLPQSFHHHMGEIGSLHGPDAPQKLLALLDLRNTYGVLTHPDVWIGALGGAVMIAAAIWFRSRRDDS